MTFEWVAFSDNLLFREDEWSWQGARKGDPMVFLRREKDDPTTLSDLNLSKLSIDQAARILADFLSASSGLNLPGSGHLRLPAVHGTLSVDDAREMLSRAVTTLGAKSVAFHVEELPHTKSTFAVTYRS